MKVLTDISDAVRDGQQVNELNENAMGLLRDLDRVQTTLGAMMGSISTRCCQSGLQRILDALPALTGRKDINRSVETFLSGLTTFWEQFSEVPTPVMPVEPTPIPRPVPVPIPVPEPEPEPEPVPEPEPLPLPE